MTKRVPLSALLVGLVVVIAATIYYLGTAATTPESLPAAADGAAKPAAAESKNGKEGELKTVNTPPRIAAGRFAPEAKSMEEFSSNPKRDPSEKLVIKISSERGFP